MGAKLPFPPPRLADFSTFGDWLARQLQLAIEVDKLKTALRCTRLANYFCFGNGVKHAQTRLIWLAW